MMYAPLLILLRVIDVNRQMMHSGVNILQGSQGYLNEAKLLLLSFTEDQFPLMMMVHSSLKKYLIIHLSMCPLQAQKCA
jgi:hypothetical protein